MKNCFWDLLTIIYNTLGIVVLSRQWKNAIYTPILIEYNLRSKGFKNLYNTNLDPILEGTDAESESSNDGDDLDPEDVEFDGIYFRFKATKGHLISKCIFGVIVLTKTPTKIL